MYISAGRSCTRNSIFHIRGRNVGSWRRSSEPQLVAVRTVVSSLTTVDGIPSTKIKRLSFFTPSSISKFLGLDDDLGWFRILLNE